jgi:PmbA protein
MAEAAEDAARAVPGVTNSEGGGASCRGRGHGRLPPAMALPQAYAGTSRGVSASVVAGEGAGMQRD